VTLFASKLPPKCQIIVNHAGGALSGKVTLWSNQPVSKDAALSLLGSALDQSGYAFVVGGRTLTLYTKSEAKTKNLPVKVGSKPEEIPKNDQIVTQIIPVKFINAVQLSRDLQALKPDSASWSANEGGNSLIVTDTQVNIRRLAEIIKALDTAISSLSSVKVFKLQYADAKAMAGVIKDLFASEDTARSGGANAAGARVQQQFRGGGPGGFGGPPGDGGGGAAGGGDASSGNGGRAATPRVVAVSEDRSNSVVVNAPADQMPIIEAMVKQLDTTVEDVTELKVFKLKFADAQETADALTNLFSDYSSSSGSSSQGFRAGQIQFGGGFGGPPGGGFQGGNPGGSSGTDQSARVQKQTRVVAVPDLRTGSVIVSAARGLMKQIEGVVANLDADPSRKEQVYVFDLQNTDPSQALSILQTLFPSQASGYNNNRMNQNQTGTGNQLNNRASQNQNNMNRSSSSAFGSGSRTGSGQSLGQ
jgi:general secretion pathway protein D